MVDVGPPPEGATPDLLADEAVAVAQRWLRAATGDTTTDERRITERLHALVEDRDGVAFTMQFVDRVLRPDALDSSAHQLRTLVRRSGLPRFLSPMDRVLLRAGAAVAPVLPGVVMPLARRRMRQMVGHLVVDADDASMQEHLERRRSEGFDLNVNLLGEAVLGEDEAARRLASTISLLEIASVDYVSVKITGIASQLQYWAWDASLERVALRLRTVFRAAAASGTFVNLDMEEYHDLHLTVAAFRSVLDDDEFLDLEAGIVIQAYLPDALGVLAELTEWAIRRRRRGGAGIKVRIVKGANLAMERVDAAMHGWTQAPYDDKADTDANFKRCLDWVCTPERTAAVRVGVGSHNLFDLAWASVLAQHRGVADRVGAEMLEGMAPAHARAIHGDGSSLLLYTPVVRPDDFDVAIAYLFRRLEENAAPGNFLHVLGTIHPDSGTFAEQELAFRAAVARRWEVATESRRDTDRSKPCEPFGTAPFRNEPESDPAVAGTRSWAQLAIQGPPAVPKAAVVDSVDAVRAAIVRGRDAHGEWAERPASERHRILRRVADELAARRGDLLHAMVHEGRKTIAQADPEICEAIDFTRYYADRALELESPSARFEPLGVVAVVPPWNFPVAIPTGGMMASLAAGNAVICKPAPEVPRCSEIVVEAAHAASVPSALLQYLRVPENDAGRHLVTDADAVILTGSIVTAEMFQSWKPDLRLFAETSGKNALVITPNADIDLAVRDLVSSAFGHAGQKCSAASIGICVGDVLDNPRFRRQLVDAVQSLAVGPATDLETSVGPLIGPPNPRLARALEELEPGEDWLVEPKQIDTETWRPGVRVGVTAGSWFHQTECFGPVLGLLRARDLDEAIRLQNGTDFGLTGGLHSLDPDEIEAWTERVEVGNAYVNRGITGAIVQRQPFGGWKLSSVGPGAKAGGPNYVAQLGVWQPTEALDPERWARSDAAAWDGKFDRPHDPTGLFCESNVFRYRPCPVVGCWIGSDADPVALERVRDAARAAGVALVEARAGEEPEDVVLTRLAARGVDRVRVLGTASERLHSAAVVAHIHLATGPVTNDGHIEGRHYVREQAVSRTLHRFGNLVQA